MRAALVCATLAGLALPFQPSPASAAGTAPPLCSPLSAVPRLAAPAAGDISLRAGAATCDTIEVEVAAQGLDGIFTVSFDVAYPPGILKYEGYAQGPLLLRDTPHQAPLFLVREEATGTLQVSMTRFSPDPAVSAVSGEVLVKLRFHRVSPGQADIDFLTGNTSAIAERILDAQGQTVTARFAPGHGATITVP